MNLIEDSGCRMDIQLTGGC